MPKYTAKIELESVEAYSKYAELTRELSAHESAMGEIRRELKNIRLILDKHINDGIALDLTSHAFTNITSRLESVINENPFIWEDVMGTDKDESLFIPSNLKYWVIAKIAKARKSGNFVIQDSKNNDGEFEFHYKIPIEEWSDVNRMLEFTAIVEGGVVKTGYFNWSKK